MPRASKTFSMAALLAVALLCATAAQAGAAERDYVVLLKGGESVGKAVAAEKARENEVLDVFSSRIRGFTATLSPRDVRRLRSADSVLVVERDKPVKALALGPRDSAVPSGAWGIDRADQRALPLNGRIATAQNGFGVDAYIIDTGVYGDHQEFSGRMAGRGYNAIGDSNGYSDCHGHGTHVAGTVAGATYGMAPEATVVPVRVLDCGGSGSTSGVIAGIDWAVADHAAGKPAVANMSLGGGYSSSLNLAVDRATADGISMAVAAGNSSADACNYSPASAASALTVGSTTATDSRSSFSNFGSCLDVFAPGSSIRSAYIGSPSASTTMSGTSMASPHVAGAAALYLSANRSAQPGAVATALGNAASPGLVTDAGPGSVNRLLYAGDPTVAPPPPPPPPPAPSNDAFASASALSSLGGVNATNVNATSEAGEPNHAGVSGGKSTWHTWTAPQAGTLQLNTLGSDYDTTLGVYTGSSVGSLSALGANDDNGSGGVWSRVVVPVSAGTVYRVAVDGYRGASGSYRLQGSFTSDAPPPPPPPPPANDSFSAATNLTSLEATDGTTVGATRESGEPSHVGAGAGGQASIWYRWTAPADGAVTLSTEGSDFDTLLAAYSGATLGSLQPLAGNDDVDPGTHWSRVSFAVQQGATYRIAIDGYGGRSGQTSVQGDFTPTPEPPPSEDPPPPSEPDLVPGMLLPLDTSLTLEGRSTVANFVCQSLAGTGDEDAPCEALVRLRTRFGSSARAVTLDVGEARQVTYRFSRKVARVVARRGSIRATMVVIDANETRLTYSMTLVGSREAARKRASKRR